MFEDFGKFVFPGSLRQAIAGFCFAGHVPFKRDHLRAEEGDLSSVFVYAGEL